MLRDRGWWCVCRFVSLGWILHVNGFANVLHIILEWLHGSVFVTLFSAVLSLPVVEHVPVA